MSIYKLKKGFTLIELLLAIALIGVISTIFLMNLSGLQERTRDTTRKKDLLTIQTALELYRADAASYPINLANCNNPIQYATVTYLKEVPCDPKSSVRYTYNSTGSPPHSYTLFACLENANDKEKDTPKKPGCPIASYTVNSP